MGYINLDPYHKLCHRASKNDPAFINPFIPKRHVYESLFHARIDSGINFDGLKLYYNDFKKI